LAPAWWFVPAIRLAYLTYPAVHAASRFRQGLPLLAVSATITMTAFALAQHDVLANETWYYIVLQESFNFSLGVVVAGWWLTGRRATLERIAGGPLAFAVACAAFVAGNIANWTPAFRPIASMLYGPGLVIMIVFVAKWLERQKVDRFVDACDPYDLYLVHQPFAFPIALLSKVAFQSYAVFAGWFIFVVVAWIAARILGIVQRPLTRTRSETKRFASPAGILSRR
jgi:peptidoglycan/LPS O-acetylase OafA/YrhL